jgi:Protein of unknown function (DUF4199)
MKRVVELRYAVLTSLATLLWLITEYVIGFQDKYISIYPFVTLCSLAVPLLCYRQAFREKRDVLGNKFTLQQALLAGFLLALFTSIFSIPVEIFFLQLINPDFMADMIRYAAVQTKQTEEAVAVYINLQSMIMETVLVTFITSGIIALALALRYRAD